MTDDQVALIAERFSHAVDLLKADTSEQREQIAQLRVTCADFETRIRSLSEAATQFRFVVSLSIGGGLLSIIALVRAIWGTP